MMIVKIHQTPEKRIMVAVCDSELIGKKFEENNLQLDLTANFYKGNQKSNEETADLMRNACIINLVGEKSIALGIKEGIIDKNHIKKIKGIPYAQNAKTET